MPVPGLPPTPAASLDITGKTSIGQAPSLTLGPAAVDQLSDRSISATPSANGSESSYHPASPVSPNAKKRKQSGTIQPKAVKPDGDFSLPPPPSRSRKIIQMKPKHEHDVEQVNPAPATSGSTAVTKSGRKRANNSGTTAAGRKIARKTAHSLIERRRRSKMNEEFGVLKDMIPACRGQEMHKLAILQASIDYLRYLESCITDLKSGNKTRPTPFSPANPMDDTSMVCERPDVLLVEDEDEEMVDGQATPEHTPAMPTSSAATTRPPTSQSLSRSAVGGSGSASHSPQTLPSLSQVATASSTASNFPGASPSFPPLDALGPPRNRHFSTSSSSAAGYSPYIFGQYGGFGSNAPSPLFSPQSKAQLNTLASGEIQRISLSSPALGPIDRRTSQQQQAAAQDKAERSDREAMAALLMLNQTHGGAGAERRSDSASTPAAWRDTEAARLGAVADGAGARKRGSGAMSVRDLLSH